MRNGLFLRAMLAALAAMLSGAPAVSAASLKAVSDTAAKGFKYPESVAYDPENKVLYVSQFGSELKPALKDGKGYIGKAGLDGKIIEERFLPAEGQTMDKPKGIWVSGDRLWVTDIDKVWEFDTKTKEGKAVALPGCKFANDVTIIGGVLYVSDNRGDQLFSVEPAEFLTADARADAVFSGKSINPNGVYPAADGSLLMVGFAGKDDKRGIHSMKPGGEPKEIASGIGRLDGLYVQKDGDLLFTDWTTGSLDAWNSKKGVQKLAGGFKGPADFTVAPNADGLLVVVPDLVKSELRLIQLGK